MRWKGLVFEKRKPEHFSKLFLCMFSSEHVVPLKDWGNPTEHAQWRDGGDGEWPFKGFSPLLLVPGSHAPRHVLLDYVHIYHLGYGMDACASAIMLLCHLGQFGSDKNMDDKLDQAYRVFDVWCKETSTRTKTRTTSIDGFSLQSFGVKSLGFNGMILIFYLHHADNPLWPLLRMTRF